MPSCSLQYCKNSSITKGIKFHRFDSRNNENREAWIEIARKDRQDDTWCPSKNNYICSAHFREEDFNYTRTGIKYLKNNAVPQVVFPISQNSGPSYGLVKENRISSASVINISKTSNRKSNAVHHPTNKKEYSYRNTRSAFGTAMDNDDDLSFISEDKATIKELKKALNEEIIAKQSLIQENIMLKQHIEELSKENEIYAEALNPKKRVRKATEIGKQKNKNLLINKHRKTSR